MQLRYVSERLLLVAVALLLPLHAAAQEGAGPAAGGVTARIDAQPGEGEPARDPDSGWVPSLRLGVGVNSQGAKGVVSANQIQNFSGTPISFTGTKSFPTDGPAIEAGLEIMGPAIGMLPGDPRPFFTAGIRDQLEGFSTVAREQARGALANRRVRLKLDVANDRWYHAGFGAAFRLPIAGLDIKVKPSLSWMALESRVRGLLIQPVLTGFSTSNANFPREEVLAITHHGLMARLEFDGEVYREGPIALGVYMGVEYQYLLTGDLKNDFFTPSCFGSALPTQTCPQVGDFPSGSFPSGQADWKMRRDDHVIQGSVGLRVSWVGY